ncbi:sialate O-acetylesterase [bacterium]|nr:sialate O-acetylesterase [bacterium]
MKWVTTIFIWLGIGLCFPLACLPSMAADEASWCFILSGQSNMVGQGTVKELPASLKNNPKNIEFYLHGSQRELAGGSQFGPEVTLAHELAAKYPRQKILLIKYAVGGTSLLAWAPEWSKERADITKNAGNGPLYANLFRFLERGIRDKNIVYKGILWMQGERDAKFPAAAAEYAENFRALVQSLREDLDAPKLPFLYGIVNPPAANYPGLADVRKAQQAFEKTVPMAKMIDTDDLAKRSDNLHYNTEGQMEMGRRFANAYLELMQSKANQLKCMK